MSRPVDWDLVAALYTDHSIPLKEIGRRCGVPASTIAGKAFRESWPPRKGRRKYKPHAKGQPTYRVLLARLFRALERQMREIEERLEPENGKSPERTAAERERDARTLAQLTRTLEKWRELQREAAQAALAAAGADERGEIPDTETRRADLERRLARLAGEADETSLPEQSE